MATSSTIKCTYIRICTGQITKSLWNHHRYGDDGSECLWNESMSHFWSIFQVFLKGIVQPKMNILSSFTLKTCMSFFLVLNTKEDILKNVGNEAVAGSHWLPYCISILTQRLPSTVWLPTFFKVSSFVFNTRKTQKFDFWVNYGFNFNAAQWMWVFSSSSRVRDVLRETAWSVVMPQSEFFFF